MPAPVAVLPDPAALVAITEDEAGRFTAVDREWNGQWRECAGHDHLTRQDALACAEQRLRYRA